MRRTRKVMLGVSTTALTIGLTGCGTNVGAPVTDLPPTPVDSNCGDWEWDADDGVWECDDEGSSFYRHYYYGGHYYPTKSKLLADKSYQDYRNSSAFKGVSSSMSNPSTVKGSTGFGSGVKSYGG